MKEVSKVTVFYSDRTEEDYDFNKVARGIEDSLTNGVFPKAIVGLDDGNGMCRYDWVCKVSLTARD